MQVTVVGAVKVEWGGILCGRLFTEMHQGLDTFGSHFQNGKGSSTAPRKDRLLARFGILGRHDVEEVDSRDEGVDPDSCIAFAARCCAAV